MDRAFEWEMKTGNCYLMIWWILFSGNLGQDFWSGSLGVFLTLMISLLPPTFLDPFYFPAERSGADVSKNCLELSDLRRSKNGRDTLTFPRLKTFLISFNSIKNLENCKLIVRWEQQSFVWANNLCKITSISGTLSSESIVVGHAVTIRGGGLGQALLDKWAWCFISTVLCKIPGIRLLKNS